MIECYELLVYFRLDPGRVQEAIDKKLPSAGKIAKKIESSFKGLRNHLNEHAAHSSFSSYSMGHLIERSSLGFRTEQLMLPKVLNKNIGVLFALLTRLAIEAINGLQNQELGYAEAQAEKIEKCKNRGFSVFELNEHIKK